MLQTNEITNFLFSCWKPWISNCLMSSSSLRIGLFLARVSCPRNWPKVFKYCLIWLTVPAVPPTLLATLLNSTSSIKRHLWKISDAI